MGNWERFFDFLLAFNVGLYTFFIGIWIYLTFWINITNNVNGYIWGALLGLSLFFIGLNIKLFFKSKVPRGAAER